VFPEVADIGRALPHVDPRLLGQDMAYPAMLTFLPEGVLGVMVAGLLAAYVSTISTHLNWGTSYLVHDLYRRFLSPGRDERHYVLVGRIVTGLLMVAAGLFTLILETARTSFDLMLSIGAGTGLLYLLRWFWWRVNAWSEVAAMAASFTVAVALFVAARNGAALPGHLSLMLSVAVTTAIWLAVTWLAPQTDRAVLKAFYRRVRPAGPGWSAIRRQADGLAPLDDLRLAFIGMAGGCACVYGALFGTGHALIGDQGWALGFALMFAAGASMLARVLPRLWTATSR
jgi:Na+/proline symporter